MKVLFNAFPLGAEIYHPGFKTGVYRVVEQLADNLARTAADPQNKLTVIFHASNLAWAARRFFQQRLRGRGTDFNMPLWQRPAAWQAHAVTRFCLGAADNRRVGARALRWLAGRGQSVVGRFSTHLTHQVLEAADIYHSPFQQIPRAVYRHAKLRRFTTVYDVIPITHPEYFEQGPIDILRGVVSNFRAEDFVTCISHHTRAQLLEHAPRLQPERVFVTHLAAGEWCRREDDPAKIAAARTMFGLGQDAPYFLSLCTLEPRKNLEAVIRAFARLRKERQIGRDHRLVLVGNSGWKTQEILAALAEAEHCREAIILTGFVLDEYLSALYSGALAFLYISRLEGFGLPPLEAMQCGVPVITSNASSLPEVVGDAGLTVDPDDIDGLCGHMLRLMNDEALRRELSVRSLARADGFSWQRYGTETLAAYRAALAMG